MKNIKKNLLMIFFFLTGLASFAYNGYMESASEIRYVSTEWFDIIFTEESAETALELSGRVDDLYREICADYGIEPFFRMPVVITRESEVFNAYYSPQSANHIVLFDAIPEEGMSVFEENIYNVFKHELTHAVSINNMGSFMQAVTGLFGDIYNMPQLYNMTVMLKEGATVSQESRTGQGRLNDEYFMHIVRQSKLMNKFPSWSTAMGEPDTFFYDSRTYGFGGPFAKWLQDTYGMEKYSELWYRAVNEVHISFTILFKNVYKISLWDAWDEFEKSIKVPDIPMDPLLVEGITAFNDKSSGNSFGVISSFDGGFVYADSATYSINVVYKNTDGSLSAPKRLLSLLYIGHVSASTDGKFVAYETIDMNEAAYKTRVGIYGIENGSQYVLDETGLSNATIFELNGKRYLAAAKAEGQNVAVNVYALNVENNIVTNASLCCQIALPRGDQVFSLNGGNNGTLAMIYKTGLEWSFREYTFENNGGLSLDWTAVEASMPLNGMRVRYMNRIAASDDMEGYSFSYTVPGSFPRLGTIVKTENGYECSLMQEELSGGVFYTAYTDADSLVYAGNFIDEFRMFCLDTSKFTFETTLQEAVPVEHTELTFNLTSQEALDFYNSAQIWKSTRLNRGYFDITLGTVPDYYLDSNVGFSPVIGWTASTPWDSDTVSLLFTVNPLSSVLGASAVIAGGTTTEHFSYSTQATLLFNWLGNNTYFAEKNEGLSFLNVFEQASVSNKITYAEFFGNHNYFMLQNSLLAVAGRFSKPLAEPFALILESMYGAELQDPKNNFFVKEQLGLGFGSVVKTGPGPFQKLSFVGQLVGEFNFISTLAGDALSASYFTNSFMNLDSARFSTNVYPVIQASLPGLIPVEYKNGWTLNLPVTLQAFAFPSSKIVAGVEAEMILLSKEIQKGTGFIPFYLNRFYMSLEYTGGIYDSTPVANPWFHLGSMDWQDMYIEDQVALNIGLQMRANSGAYASMSPSPIKLSIIYHLNTETPMVTPFEVKILNGFSF